MRRPRVFLAGPDRFNWAFDENMRLTALALQGIAEMAPLEECDVVHAMWWGGVTVIPGHHLRGRRVLAYTCITAPWSSPMIAPPSAPPPPAHPGPRLPIKAFMFPSLSARSSRRSPSQSPVPTVLHPTGGSSLSTAPPI